jgi:hypothetical protein
MTLRKGKLHKLKIASYCLRLTCWLPPVSARKSISD